MSPENVSVLIPALDEAAAIGTVVQNIRQRLPEAEILVIDDGSSDRTGEIAAEAGARVLRHEWPEGYGASLADGTRNATREYVLFCDGDGQHSAEDVARLVAESDGYDMVVGQRDRNSHSQFSRRPGKLILKWFANYLAGQKIPDLNSGLRILRRSVLLNYLHLMPEGFSFSTTSTFAMLKTRRRIKYVPITVAPRIGKSTVRQVKHGFQTIMLMIRLTVLFEPLKVFLTVSGILFLLTLISFGIDMVQTFYIQSVQGAGITDTTVLLSIATLIIFMFGLLCDQVSAIRRDSCVISDASIREPSARR